jgi:hypothetical protein
MPRPQAQESAPLGAPFRRCAHPSGISPGLEPVAAPMPEPAALVPVAPLPQGLPDVRPAPRPITGVTYLLPGAAQAVATPRRRVRGWLVAGMIAGGTLMFAVGHGLPSMMAESTPNPPSTASGLPTAADREQAYNTEQWEMNKACEVYVQVKERPTTAEGMTFKSYWDVAANRHQMQGESTQRFLFNKCMSALHIGAWRWIIESCVSNGKTHRVHGRSDA